MANIGGNSIIYQRIYVKIKKAGTKIDRSCYNVFSQSNLVKLILYFHKPIYVFNKIPCLIAMPHKSFWSFHNGVIRPEIGYHIAKRFQRQGYAREAARRCRDWAFENTPFNILYSYMKKENISSAAVAVANGMRFIEEFTDGGKELTAVYGITREEWGLRKQNES